MRHSHEAGWRAGRTAGRLARRPWSRKRSRTVPELTSPRMVPTVAVAAWNLFRRCETVTQPSRYWVVTCGRLKRSSFRDQELCESRGGRPGLNKPYGFPVDVKRHWTMLTHWSQFVPNMSTRHPRTLSNTRRRSGVGQKWFQSSRSDATTTKHCLNTPNFLAVVDTDVPLTNSSDFTTRRGILPEAFFWTKSVAKARQWTLLVTPFLWPAREFWETASTIDNFTPSDFKDPWTVIMHSGKI